jgi:excisionase family DNA binding protein
MSKEVPSDSTSNSEAATQRRDVPKLALSLEEAAFALSMSKRTVRRLVRRGELRRCLAVRTYCIAVKEIERFLKDSQ